MTISTVNKTGVLYNLWKYTAVGGETSLSGLDDNGNTLQYNVGTQLVFKNGILLISGTNYTATTGTSITGLSALSAGNVITVVSIVTAVLPNYIPSATFTSANQILVGTGAGTYNATTTASNLTLNGAALSYPFENWYINAVALTTSGYNLYAQTNNSVHYLTSSATGSGILNISYSSGTTLNSVMAVGEAITVAVLVTNGATGYIINGVKVDGTTVTPKWTGGVTPTSGSTSAIDVYQFTVLKTASATFTVLASGPIKYA